jgi:hypothetical protein
LLFGSRFRSLFWALPLAICACKESTPALDEAGPARSAAPDPTEAREQVVASALASVRAELPLAAPAWKAQPLATGKNLLVRLREDAVEAYSAPGFDRALDKPLPGARAAVAVAGGSVVVVGARSAMRVDPGAREPVLLPALTWTPGMLGLPERRSSAVLFTVERATRSLFQQSLSESPDAGAPEALPLEDYDGGPIAVLRDGALLYRAPGGVRRATPRGRPHPLATTLVPWRLLPARRVDQAWAIDEQGAVELWQIGERVLVRERFELAAPPFDVSSSSDYLAAVTVDEGPGRSRVFHLRVFSNEGKLVLERALSKGPPPVGESWAARAVRDRHVVLGDGEPFVAVGGPGALLVLRLPHGEILRER